MSGKNGVRNKWRAQVSPETEAELFEAARDAVLRAKAADEAHFVVWWETGGREECIREHLRLTANNPQPTKKRKQLQETRTDG